MEKEAYNNAQFEKDSGESPPNEAAKIVEEKGIQLGEAADLYGDIHAAEEYGYVKRGLKSRHIQFIALGGTIGTGLFLGIGRSFAQAGPLSILLGYTFTGVAIYAMMMSLGEMATWLPLPGAIPQFCARYVDGAMGFAVGWNNWYNSAITLCAEISAASVVIQFWNGAQDINVAAWISLIIVLVICLNIFAVAIYGEAEFCFASIKIITIVGLIIFAFIIDLGGGPTHDRLGFRYWNNPGAMKEYKGTGSTGRFLGLFSVLVNAAFSYGLLVGSKWLRWVIAVYRAGVPVLPSIINAVILTSATSSANAFLFTGSRYLYALAQNGQAPRFLLKCSRRGVPYYCIIITAAISLLTYMSCSSGANVVFEWFQNLTTIANLFTWMSVSVAYIKFHAALKAQNVDRSTLVFRSPFQPYTAWFSLIFFAIITVFNGFYVFGPFDVNSFVTAYVGVPIYFALFVFWKIFKRTKWLKPEEADIFTGKDALDAQYWPPRVARNMMERIWFWIA
ncbi:MAG: hypothetical protein Q9202_004446 [Teloschistes flavicans]